MLRVICSPYHLGRTDVGMSTGASRLLDAAAEVLAPYEHEVTWVELPEREVKLDHEIGNAFAVQAAQGELARAARCAGETPVFLGGNCSTILAARAGAPADEGLVFYDSHADANTPDTTESGFIDGMPVSVVTGRCWHRLAAQVPHFSVLNDRAVMLVGLRSVDPLEQELLDASGMWQVTTDELQGERSVLSRSLEGFATGVRTTHLHMDLDVMDPTDGGYANEQWTTEAGPSTDDLIGSLHQVAEHVPVTSVSMTGYNPKTDADGRALVTATAILEALLEIVSTERARRRTLRT